MGTRVLISAGWYQSLKGGKAHDRSQPLYRQSIRVQRQTGKDDSMMPTLNDGDVVLVDMNQRSPVLPGIFVLHDGMGLVAKRLEYVRMSDPPRLQIISDNYQYSPYECTAEEVNIVGRVRWYGREM